MAAPSLTGRFIRMILIPILATTIAVIWFAERSIAQLGLALAAYGVFTTLLLIVTADIERALLLASLLVIATTLASLVKYSHSGLKLIVTDLPLLFAGTTPFFFTQYPLAVAGVAAGTVVLFAAATATVLGIDGEALPLAARLTLLCAASICLMVAWAAGGGNAPFQLIAAERRCFFSAFIASLLDARSWVKFGGLDFSDIAHEPLPLMDAVPGRIADFPDIIVIQHESIFDPRLYGLPVDPAIDAFLSPPDGWHGRLNVDIFGGGSWQSEFSVLTGLSSASFGSSAYYLFKRGVGRFRNSLPDALTALGYKTALASSCRRSFLNYDQFYAAVGMSERIFTDDLPPPFDLARFETTHSDAQFLPAAIATHMAGISDGAAPRFLYALTNFNHGPHNRRLTSPGQSDDARAFAHASLAVPHYAEYYARLEETAATWKQVRHELSAHQRPTLIVHYGDHQPVMIRRIEAKLKLPPDPRRQFRTFYAVEALNFEPGRFRAGRGADLDIAFLGTVALQLAGLPLDRIFATRASLIDQCGDGYFASVSERKRRFHRTLVDLGAINLAEPS
ncbi:hypothetical protein RPMA_23485 [Tardiphaga alba]|uniref:Sulfatase N-terminal domain-containing protein n=1 Tax=Tardiphaga alba TaxID=340268 RepID=A0ABX8ACI0_9BRAD|nr:sulfatase-like hydrolase/transferase [Tardiphaga alba]QUS41474.1 hypothetical protein RPMA_23485 [Tardiphaga alba]